jgi:hypothetical protein
MTGTDLCVNKPHKFRSYLNHLVFNRFQLFFLLVNTKYYGMQKLLNVT